jgi:hypothetical protein
MSVNDCVVIHFVLLCVASGERERESTAVYSDAGRCGSVPDDDDDDTGRTAQHDKI